MEHDPILSKDIAPELSKRAKKINMRKLESVPWAHDGSHPGSAWFWKFITTILLVPWSYLFRRKEVEEPHQTDGGRTMCCYPCKWFGRSNLHHNE